MHWQLPGAKKSFAILKGVDRQKNRRIIAANFQGPDFTVTQCSIPQARKVSCPNFNRSTHNDLRRLYQRITPSEYSYLEGFLIPSRSGTKALIGKLIGAFCFSMFTNSELITELIPIRVK